ncbi:MAG: putative oxidoreductase [Candidatus Syntrophoarchaeum sp. GoM_oil]|nr:MAG: putative oxidoreductase [Candidatus Syntrophoarchaeum sp. GoM_oil]
MEKISVGVIGIGSMGKNHLRIYSELKDVEEVYAFDTDHQNLDGVGVHGAISCSSMDELLESVDAVSICVPTGHHLEVAKSVIESGVHALIEKPITRTVKEGEELLDLLKDEGQGLTVGVGHIERFNPIIKEIKNITRHPLYAEFKRHNPTSTRITDASVVEDLMVHDIDIVFNVLFSGKYEIFSAGNDDLCKTLIKFGSSIVSISASRKSSKKIRTIYIEEEDFTIEGDFMNQEIYVYHKPEKYGVESERYMQENIIEKVLVNKVEPLKEELKAFIQAARKSEAFEITPVQAVNNLRVCEAIRRLNGAL